MTRYIVMIKNQHVRPKLVYSNTLFLIMLLNVYVGLLVGHLLHWKMHGARYL